MKILWPSKQKETIKSKLLPRNWPKTLLNKKIKWENKSNKLQWQLLGIFPIKVTFNEYVNTYFPINLF